MRVGPVQSGALLHLRNIGFGSLQDGEVGIVGAKKTLGTLNVSDLAPPSSLSCGTNSISTLADALDVKRRDTLPLTAAVHLPARCRRKYESAIYGRSVLRAP
jgi:hypothetical protein